MKDYETPNINFHYFEDCDVLTGSVGTSNDNDYEDIESWF